MNNEFYCRLWLLFIIYVAHQDTIYDYYYLYIIIE